MTIPEVARRLRLKALETGDDELLTLAEAILLNEEIREYADLNPALPHGLIGIAFGVSPGRVSEALHGKRS